MTDTDLVFTFVNLFAGIGGCRWEPEQVGDRSVYSAESDRSGTNEL
jgi:hypothetical protein